MAPLFSRTRPAAPVEPGPRLIKYCLDRASRATSPNGDERYAMTTAKSLMRMLGPKGSPSVANFTAILGALRKTEGVHFELAVAPG